ncbi:MAG: Npt1/Npt2 family nucleotide transporter [Bdellovibrionota bacterium]
MANALTLRLRGILSLPPKDLVASLLMGLAAAFLLGGYEFTRSPSYTLFQSAYGTKNLPLVQVGIPICSLILIYIYGWILSRFGPRRTLAITTLLSGAIIMACYIVINHGYLPATAVLFIFREAYIVLIIEQYWSFLNSTLCENSARTMNNLIIGISSIGAIIGGILVYKLSQAVGTVSLLMLAAASVVPSALVSDLAYRFCGEPMETNISPKNSGAVKHLGLKSFSSSPILIFLFLLILLTQAVSTVLGLNFQTHLQNEISTLDAQTAYSGRFYAILNGVAAFFQFVGGPLILSLASATRVQIAIPIIHITAVVLFILSPSLFTAGLAFLVFKAFDYSIFRATKEIFYIPLSFEARYRAKEVIDVFGYRFSKGGTSLFVFLVEKTGIAGRYLFPIASLAACMLWLLALIPITREAAREKTDVS